MTGGVAYLHSHLPLKNKMLASLAFLSPKERKNPHLIQMTQGVMKRLKRFDDEEMVQASTSLKNSTVMAIKIIREEMMRVGGAQNVTIIHNLLTSCRKARAEYFDALKKEHDEEKKKKVSGSKRIGKEETQTF